LGQVVQDNLAAETHEATVVVIQFLIQLPQQEAVVEVLVVLAVWLVVLAAVNHIRLAKVLEQ
jgi:hypothetical protein